MKTTFLKSLTGVTATMLLAGYAGAQVTIPEVEGNETKAAATPASGLVSGDMLTGTTTGTSTTVGAANSVDVFRVKTAAAALGVYRHRLVLTTTGTAGHTGAIMGVGSSGAPSESTNVLASITGSTPARMVQWYGFGKQEELFYKVSGTTSTTAPYVANYTSAPVTVINVGNIAQGNVVMTTVGQTTTDTEMFLYDSNFNLLRLNDDDFVSATARSRISQNLTPGQYYLAISEYNTATSSALEPTGAASGENTTAGSRMDFPNSIVGSTTGTNVNVSFTINDGVGPHPFTATRGAFEVVFATFTVINTSTNPQGTFNANPSTVQAGNSTLFTVNVTPGASPASTGITVVGDLSSVGGSSTQSFFDDGTNGDVTGGDNIFSYAYTIPGATTGGAKTIPFTVADAQARSTNGNGGVTIVAPPAAIDIGTLTPGSNTAPTQAVGLAQIQWYKFTLATPVSVGDGNYLDIVSNGALSGGSFTNDTEIGLFTSAGAVVNSDDDDGPGSFSALTFGMTTPTRVNGDGPVHNGRDGSLPAGTYYLAVSGYNGTYLTGWNATTDSNSTGSVGATLTLGPVSTNPTITGNSVGALPGGSVLLTGTVVPGTLPTSSGLAVTANLSAFGGSASQAMVDDGTGGDAVAGDNVFSYSLTIPGAQAAGNYTVALSVSDAQARSGSGSATVAVDDAGSLPSNARHIDGVGAVTSITGSISPNDVDMFRIFICDPASFSATVATGGGTLADSQLFLFRPDGTGVAFNDDQADSPLSQITGPITAALTPGEYYLAISDYNNDPHDAANNLIWANSPFTGVRPPDGPGAANALASWDTGGGDTGTYTITLAGVNGEPCAPPTGSCCLGQYCLVTTADDCAGQGGSFGGAGTDCSTSPCAANCGTSDFNHDGDFGTDSDIEAFFACLGGVCCPTCDTSDFNGDSDFGTDADIEAFFRVLGGGAC